LTRERGTLITERIRRSNRIKGLLATQGVFDFEPMRKGHPGASKNCAGGMANRCHRG